MKSILLLVALILSARAADLPRVAVVPDSPEPSVAAFADFLSVSLASASSQYALVERAELTRLASEAEIQKLAADQRPAALAKLAKADGLIIVGTDKGDPKLPKLTLRLTSTNNGLVLRSLILGGKQDEYPKAAELAAGVLRFPCERLTHGDAKPPIIVSLLGIRPAFEIDRALETTLNLAVAQQLSGQSGIAVSERWKMNDLVFERSLADEKPQSFATGTVLLDGSYTRKGDEMEITLRLRKAEAEAWKTLTLQGPANKPADLAQQIAKLVATEAGLSGEADAWDAVKEGKQYADLGSWLLDRRMYEEAAQASESAVAMGCLENDVLWVRSAAYLGEFCDGESYAIKDSGVYGWEKLPEFDFKWKVGQTIRKTQCLIELMDARWKGARRDRGFTMGANLYFNLRILEAICVRGEQHVLATEARILRALTRQIVKRGESEIGWRFSDAHVRRVYMFDDPLAAIQDMRRILGREEFTHTSPEAAIRYELWKTCTANGPWRVVDWTETDNRNGRALWKRFVAELQASICMLNRIDGLSIAFQESDSEGERSRLLDAYCSLVESDPAVFATPKGQSWLGVFGNRWIDSAPSLRPRFEERFARIWRGIFRSADWINPDLILHVSSSVRLWVGTEEPPGRTRVPVTLAVELLDAVEAYVARARQDPRWEKNYRTYIREWLQGIPGKIVSAYPDLKKSRVKPSKTVDGSVAIRSWNPQLSGAGMVPGMIGDCLVARKNTLLIPYEGLCIIELDVSKMAVSRVIGFPIKDCDGVAGLAANDTSLLLNADNRLFTLPLAGTAAGWNEIEIPASGWKTKLAWHVVGWRDEFFVGSVIKNDTILPLQMMAGKIRNGQLTWLASSGRRPSVTPLDEMEPRSVCLAYPNAEGNTVVLLESSYVRASLVEMETGRNVSPCVPMAVHQNRGEMPVSWIFDEDAIGFLVMHEPTGPGPRMIFKPIPGSNRTLPDRLKAMPSVYDGSRPEFRGQSIAAIVHGGHLWLLKREPFVAGRMEKNDPNDFRLLRLDLHGGAPVVIPLRYDVPEAARVGGTAMRSTWERPVINRQSLSATPKGLFFAISGNSYGGGMSFRNGIPSGGQNTPGLLYITWDDIHEWLAKNVPETAKPAPESVKTTSP